jgi:hypothetical protein
MENVGGPDAKKARWSPTFAGQNGTSSNSNNRDAFANYGYGPQASIAQSAAFTNSPTSAGFAANPLYTTPSLSINTQTTGNGMPSQLSPNNAAAAAFAAQQSQQQQHGQQQQQQSNQQQQGNQNGNGYAAGFAGYNMLGMGLPGMNILGNFPYNGQMAGFAQVTTTSQDVYFLRFADGFSELQQPATSPFSQPQHSRGSSSCGSSGVLAGCIVGCHISIEQRNWPNCIRW